MLKFIGFVFLGLMMFIIAKRLTKLLIKVVDGFFDKIEEKIG